MISVAPATHSFGTVHTEESGGATLNLGNPTYADAEWSLSHIPAPPPKKRASDTNIRVKDRVPPAKHLAFVSSRAKVLRHNEILGAHSEGQNHERYASSAWVPPIKIVEPRVNAVQGRIKGTTAATVVARAVVDDPSVFVFGEDVGVAPGVKLPLASSAACLPEDWNRHEVGATQTSRHAQLHCYPPLHVLSLPLRNLSYFEIVGVMLTGPGCMPFPSITASDEASLTPARFFTLSRKP